MNGIQLRLTKSIVAQPRFEVDPNQASRRNPDWNTAELSEGPNVRVGQSVAVVQPDDESTDFVGTAVVRAIDPEFGLVYLEVDWATFHSEQSAWTIENFASPANLSSFVGSVVKRATSTGMPWAGNTTTVNKGVLVA